VKLVSLGGGTRPAGLTCWAGRPHLSAFGLLLHSCVFSCPLEPSHPFSWNFDLIWSGFLTPTPSRLILFLSLKIHNSPKLWKLLLVPKTLAW
jgi:hypothetical protein